MLFMVVEKFKGQDGKAVYRKLRDKGRGAARRAEVRGELRHGRS